MTASPIPDPDPFHVESGGFQPPPWDDWAGVYTVAYYLMQAGKAAVERAWSEGGHAKVSEPRLTINWESDGSWSFSFYSYCLDLDEGGRHHDGGAHATLRELSDAIAAMADSAHNETRTGDGG